MDKMTTDAYLEHYGVLGMKWGIRRDRENETPQEKHIRKIKRDRRVAKALSAASIAVTVGFGALKAYEFLNGGSVRKAPKAYTVSDAQRASWYKTGRDGTLRLNNRLGSTSVSSINDAMRSSPSVSKVVRDASGAIPLGPTRVSGPSSSGRAIIDKARAARSRRSEFDSLVNQHAMLRSLADSDLKSLYDQTGTPMHLRQYLRNDSPTRYRL